MLNRRGFLKNLLGVGAVLTCTPALAPMKEAGYALPESWDERSIDGLSDADLDALLAKYPTVFSCQVKVITVRSITFRDHSMQVNVECMCVDNFSDAFKAELIFFPQSVAEKETILAEFKVDSILAVKGALSISLDDRDITVFVKEYRTVEPEFARWIREASDWGERDDHSLPLQWRV